MDDAPEAPEEKEPYEEYDGEAGPRFICARREEAEELVCESDESYTCSDVGTTTGNILDRLIRDPQCRRPPCLAKWPTDPPRSDTEFQNNEHQLRASLKTTPLAQMCALNATSEPHKYRQPAIICTIGPASSDVNTIVGLLEAGMNIVRISMAHTDPCSLTDPFKNIIEASNQYSTMKDFEIPIGILMDLKGPEIRTGKISYGRKDSNQAEVTLKENSYIRLTCDTIFAEKCSDKVIYIDYPQLLDTVAEGMIINISDNITLKVDSVELLCILCTVVTGGVLKNYKRVHVKGVPVLLPPITDYDKECLKLAVEYDIDAISIPLARNSDVVKQAKKYLDSIQENNNILVFAKISNYEGLERIDEILRAADGIIIEETDLCLDLSPEKMIIAQKQIIGKCNRFGKPVLRTAQLSISNATEPIYKKIIMNDIGGAVVDGIDGIILCKDTALASDCSENVVQLSKIMREAEAATMQKPFFCDLSNEHEPSLEPCQGIALAAVQISDIIQATAILAITTSGRTARLLSWYRPRCPVIAITRCSKVARQMNFWRAIFPLHFSAPVHPDWFHDVKARFQYGIAYGNENTIINSGDLLVLVSGYRKRAGFTNCIRIVYATTEKNNFDDNLPNYYASSKDISSAEKFKL